MRRRFRILPKLFAAFVLFAAGTASVAAEEGVDTFGPFSLVPGQPGTLAFEGAVHFGSAGMFLWALETTGIPERLILNSFGGSVEDALFIADVVRTRRIETEIPAGSVCYSACVVVFFAGVGRHAIGELGVHRFVEGLEGYTLPENALVTAMSQATLRRFGASPELVDLAWATPIEEMRILTPDEVVAFGVNRTREEGLRLAPEEDIPMGAYEADTALDPLEMVADFAPGVTLTIRRTGQPDETHFGAVRWEVGERQGVVVATVAVPDFAIAYQFMFAPFTSEDEPYLYGGIMLTKLDDNGGIPIERMHTISVAYPTPDNPAQYMQIGQAARPMTIATTILNLPRFARELDVDRFHRAVAFQLSLSLDGTTDNLIFVTFEVGEAGHAAFERALPAWTGH